MAVIGINYEEGSKEKDLGYESVYLYTNNYEMLFSSGDFIKDWYNCNKYITEKLEKDEKYIGCSSSFDHFLMDGDLFDSTYLKFQKDDTPYLDYEFDFQNQGIEFFVKKGETPTWEQLKKYCTDEKDTKKT